MKMMLLLLCRNVDIWKTKCSSAELLKDMDFKVKYAQGNINNIFNSQKELYNLPGFPEILVCKINNECFKLTYNIYIYMCSFLRNWNTLLKFKIFTTRDTKFKCCTFGTWRISDTLPWWLAAFMCILDATEGWILFSHPIYYPEGFFF